MLSASSSPKPISKQKINYFPHKVYNELFALKRKLDEGCTNYDGFFGRLLKNTIIEEKDGKILVKTIIVEEEDGNTLAAEKKGANNAVERLACKLLWIRVAGGAPIGPEGLVCSREESAICKEILGENWEKIITATFQGKTFKKIIKQIQKISSEYIKEWEEEEKIKELRRIQIFISESFKKSYSQKYLVNFRGNDLSITVRSKGIKEELEEILKQAGYKKEGFLSIRKDFHYSFEDEMPSIGQRAYFLVFDNGKRLAEHFSNQQPKDLQFNTTQQSQEYKDSKETKELKAAEQKPQSVPIETQKSEQELHLNRLQKLFAPHLVQLEEVADTKDANKIERITITVFGEINFHQIRNLLSEGEYRLNKEFKLCQLDDKQGIAAVKFILLDHGNLLRKHSYYPAVLPSYSSRTKETKETRNESVGSSLAPSYQEFLKESESFSKNIKEKIVSGDKVFPLPDHKKLEKIIAYRNNLAGQLKTASLIYGKNTNQILEEIKNIDWMLVTEVFNHQELKNWEGEYDHAEHIKNILHSIKMAKIAENYFCKLAKQCQESAEFFKLKNVLAHKIYIDLAGKYQGWVDDFRRNVGTYEARIAKTVKAKGLQLDRDGVIEHGARKRNRKSGKQRTITQVVEENAIVAEIAAYDEWRGLTEQKKADLVKEDPQYWEFVLKNALHFTTGQQRTQQIQPRPNNNAASLSDLDVFTAVEFKNNQNPSDQKQTTAGSAAAASGSQLETKESKKSVLPGVTSTDQKSDNGSKSETKESKETSPPGAASTNRPTLVAPIRRLPQKTIRKPDNNKPDTTLGQSEAERDEEKQNEVTDKILLEKYKAASRKAFKRYQKQAKQDAITFKQLEIKAIQNKLKTALSKLQLNSKIEVSLALGMPAVITLINSNQDLRNADKEKIIYFVNLLSKTQPKTFSYQDKVFIDVSKDTVEAIFRYAETKNEAKPVCSVGEQKETKASDSKVSDSDQYFSLDELIKIGKRSNEIEQEVLKLLFGLQIKSKVIVAYGINGMIIRLIDDNIKRLTKEVKLISVTLPESPVQYKQISQSVVNINFDPFEAISWLEAARKYKSNLSQAESKTSDQKETKKQPVKIMDRSEAWTPEEKARRAANRFQEEKLFQRKQEEAKADQDLIFTFHDLLKYKLAIQSKINIQLQRSGEVVITLKDNSPWVCKRDYERLARFIGIETKDENDLDTYIDTHQGLASYFNESKVTDPLGLSISMGYLLPEVSAKSRSITLTQQQRKLLIEKNTKILNMARELARITSNNLKVIMPNTNFRVTTDISGGLCVEFIDQDEKNPNQAIKRKRENLGKFFKLMKEGKEKLYPEHKEMKVDDQSNGDAENPAYAYFPRTQAAYIFAAIEYQIEQQELRLQKAKDDLQRTLAEQTERLEQKDAKKSATVPAISSAPAMKSPPWVLDSLRVKPDSLKSTVQPKATRNTVSAPEEPPQAASQRRLG